MAAYGSDRAFVLVDGRSITGNLTDFSDNQEAVLEECTVLGDTWQQQCYVGLNRADIALNGYYDDAALKSVEAFSTRPGTTSILSYGIAGNVAGKPFTGYSGALQANVERVVSRGSIHKLNVKFQGSGRVEEGRILRAYSSATASTGNNQSARYDLGASSTRGGAGYLHLTSFVMDTATNFAVWIRHSSDDATFTNLVTFTPSSDTAVAPVAQRTTAMGATAIEQYVAVAWQFGSTAAPGGATRNADFFVGFVPY